MRATRHETASFPIQLAVVDAPLGITVESVTVAVDQEELPVTLSLPPEASPGGRCNLILSGSMSTGQEVVTRILPAIPIEVIAPEL